MKISFNRIERFAENMLKTHPSNSYIYRLSDVIFKIFQWSVFIALVKNFGEQTESNRLIMVSNFLYVILIVGSGSAIGSFVYSFLHWIDNKNGRFLNLLFIFLAILIAISASIYCQAVISSMIADVMKSYHLAKLKVC